MDWNIFENIRLKERQKAATRIAIGVGIGLAVGTLLGILLAPKEGSRTREELADFAKDGVKSVKTAAGKAVKKVKREE